MHQINARGTFMVSKYAIPHLLKAENPHILMLSPPLDMKEKWFAPHTAYTMAKFGMSLVVLGLAGELRGKVAVNALWPRTTIATAAIKNLLGGDADDAAVAHAGDLGRCRLSRSSRSRKSFTGQFPDRRHASSPAKASPISTAIAPTRRSRCRSDFFVPDDMPPPKGVSLASALRVDAGQPSHRRAVYSCRTA